MARSGPPAYAWDWFARQRLLWRDVQSRLVASADPAAARYAAVEARTDVVAMLRADYPRDAVVRETVHEVVAGLAFLGHVDGPFARLGVTNPPRGMRWWWTALTGEDLDRPDALPAPARSQSAQLTLDDVHEGYGG